MPTQSSGSLSTARSSIFSLGRTPTHAAQRIESFIERRWNVNASEINLALWCPGDKLISKVSTCTFPRANGHPSVSGNDEYMDLGSELSSLESAEVSTPFSLTASILEYPESDQPFVATAKRQLYRSGPIYGPAHPHSRAVSQGLTEHSTESCGSKGRSTYGHEAQLSYGLLTPARSISQVLSAVPLSDRSHTVHTWRASLSQTSFETNDLSSVYSYSGTTSRSCHDRLPITSRANSRLFNGGVPRSAESEAGPYQFRQPGTQDIDQSPQPLSQPFTHLQHKQPCLVRGGPQEITIIPVHVQGVSQGRDDSDNIARKLPPPTPIVSSENNENQSNAASSDRWNKQCNSSSRCRSSATRPATPLEPECDVVGDERFHFHVMRDNRASRSSHKNPAEPLFGGLRRWWRTRLTRRFSLSASCRKDLPRSFSR